MANRTKEEDRIYQATWRENNRDKTRASALRYYNKKKSDPEWVAIHGQRYKEWVLANPDGNRQRNKKYRKAKPDRFAVYHIRKNYKVSLEEAERLFEQKEKGCEVCKVQGPMHIDHDHKTGAVRGILCHGCNLAFGHAKESPEILRALADYAEKHQLFT